MRSIWPRRTSSGPVTAPPPPPSDRETQLANSVLTLARSGERQAAAVERLARTVEEGSAQAERREREWLDELRRSEAAAADRERRWLEYVGSLEKNLALLDRGMQDVDREVGAVREATGKFPTQRPEDRSRRTSAPPPEAGKGAWAMYQWRKMPTWGKVSFILLLLLTLQVFLHPAHTGIAKVLGEVVAPAERSEDSR